MHHRRRGWAWVAVGSLIGLVVYVDVTVAILPAEVNSLAYVIGVGNQGTFNPVSYGQACSKGGCHTVTQGYLSD